MASSSIEAAAAEIKPTNVLARGRSRVRSQGRYSNRVRTIEQVDPIIGQDRTPSEIGFFSFGRPQEGGEEDSIIECIVEEPENQGHSRRFEV